MKKNKKFIIALLSLPCAFIFTFCSAKTFSDSLACNELSSTLQKEISVPYGEFGEYSSADLNLFFPDSELFDDFYVIYSKDNTDVSELGILRASNEENAKKLLEDAQLYIKDNQEQKREFLRNYSPSELEKLNSAEARRFGNYVIFTVADQDEKSKIFQKAEELLKK